MTSDLARLATRTQAVYERHAARYDAERAKTLFERAWLDRFTDGLNPGAALLDVGCGAGDPIAFHLLDAGYAVTGLDASPAMIALARRRRPGGDWRLADMRALDPAPDPAPDTATPPALDPGARYDGVIAWDSFFHLTPDEQRAVLPALVRRLKPGGRLMVTVGPKAGEVAGRVGGEPVYHASLSLADYEALLAGAGAGVRAFVREDPACDRHTVLLAERAR